MRRLVLPLFLLAGCGSAIATPENPPIAAPPPTAAPAPPASPGAPAPAAPPSSPGDVPPPAATGCTPMPLVTSPPGTVTQFQSLALDGASLAFLEWVTWLKTTGTNDGEYLSVVDTAAGTTKTRLAHFVGGAQTFAFDASAYYVAIWGNAAATGDGLGSLARVERGTNATSTIASGLSLAWSIATSGDTLLFGSHTPDDEDVELLSMPKAGGASTSIGTGLQELTRLLGDADGTTWIQGSSIVHRAGGVTTVLATGAAPFVNTALARAGDTLYFADAQGVLSVPLGGGAVSRVANAPRVLEVFADAKTIAWLQGPSSGPDLAIHDDAVLVAMPASGGGAVTAAHVHAPHDLVADTASFYWVDDQTQIQRVCRPF